MSSNRQRGEKLRLIGTDEFLSLDIQLGVTKLRATAHKYSSYPNQSYRKISRTIRGVSFNRIIMDEIEAEKERSKFLAKKAGEEIYRIHPTWLAGLLGVEESREITDWIMECDSWDYGMIFMFHCFNILMEDGELPG